MGGFFPGGGCLVRCPGDRRPGAGEWAVAGKGEKVRRPTHVGRSFGGRGWCWGPNVSKTWGRFGGPFTVGRRRAGASRRPLFGLGLGSASACFFVPVRAPDHRHSLSKRKGLRDGYLATSFQARPGAHPQFIDVLISGFSSCSSYVMKNRGPGAGGERNLHGKILRGRTDFVLSLFVLCPSLHLTKTFRGGASPRSSIGGLQTTLGPIGGGFGREASTVLARLGRSGGGGGAAGR